jgi:hypothetical protein
MNQPRIRVPADPLLNCPSCGLPAEITDRFMLDGAPGPVEHVKLVCVQGHWYTLAVDQLAPSKPEPDRPLDPGSVVCSNRRAPHPRYHPGRPSTEYPADHKGRSETGGRDS